MISQKSIPSMEDEKANIHIKKARPDIHRAISKILERTVRIVKKEITIYISSIKIDSTIMLVSFFSYNIGR